MNTRAIRAVIRKDLTVVLRSPMILLPMILLPMILQVIMPVGMGLTTQLAADEIASETEDIEEFVAILPAELAEQYRALDEGTFFLVVMLVYLFAPLFLIVPMMVSSVIAADSFVGERERGTLEALLYTPLTDTEMLVAKMLTAWLAAMVVSIGSFVIYAVIVNILIGGAVPFPNLTWLLLVFWVSPAVAGIGLAMMVLISSRVKTFQEAYQFGGIVVVPIIALMLGQISGLFFLGPLATFLLGVVCWGVTGILFLIGKDTFQRDEMLARL